MPQSNLCELGLTLELPEERKSTMPDMPCRLHTLRNGRMTIHILNEVSLLLRDCMQRAEEWSKSVRLFLEDLKQG